jgi:mono/diheme cytochrome c family protein
VAPAIARFMAACAHGVVPWLCAGVLAAGGGIELTARATATQPSLREGERLFRSYCAACHGEDGRGHGPAASALKTRPPDLTAIARRYGGTFPRDRLIRDIAEGDRPIAAHGSKEMPIWGPNLTALGLGPAEASEQVGAIVSYLGSIQRGR